MAVSWSPSKAYRGNHIVPFHSAKVDKTFESCDFRWISARLARPRCCGVVALGLNSEENAYSFPDGFFLLRLETG
jgi:hypothetical protein